MSAQREETMASRYLAAAGHTEGGRYQLAIEHLAWLVDHCTHLGGLRVELLRALQSTLPRSDEGTVAELKELLTNLIIMQTRLADRDERLHDLLSQLVEAEVIDRVDVDEDLLREAIQRVVEVSAHISVSGRQ